MQSVIQRIVWLVEEEEEDEEEYYLEDKCRVTGYLQILTTVGGEGGRLVPCAEKLSEQSN